MTIITVVFSILALAFAVWLFGKLFSFIVCPICAGVSLTWIGILVGILLGGLPTAEFQLPMAILMGGSVVGIAYKLEDKLRNGRSQLLWKSLFISIGFAFVYSLAIFDWYAVTGAGIFLAVVIFSFVGRKSAYIGGAEDANKVVAELTEKMKSCC